jgi:hypothetical protein
MKKLIYSIVLGLALVAASSCSDFLKEEDRTGNTESKYNTPIGLKGLVDASYAYTRAWYGKEPGIALSEAGADLFLRGCDNRTKGLCTYGTIGHLTPDPANNSNEDPALDEYWEIFWAAINTCNTALEYASASDLADARHYAGEAAFLRAFYYWHVVEIWGAAPIMREPARSASTEPVRDSEAAIYDFMLEDLETAIDNLSDATAKTGRINLWTAKAFKARLLLYLASEYNGGNYPGGAAKAYADAASAAQEVIAGSGATLYSNAADVWNQAHEDFVKNDEVIWGVEYNTDPSLNGLPSKLSVDNNGKYNFWSQMVARTKDALTGGNASHLMFTGLWNKSRIESAGLGKQIALVTRPETVDVKLPYYDASGTKQELVVNPYFQTYSKGFCRFAPSGYLLDLFADGDQRYQASFRDAYKIPQQFVSNKTASSAKSYFDLNESDTVIYLCPKRSLPANIAVAKPNRKYIVGTRIDEDGAGGNIEVGTSCYPMYTSEAGDRLTGEGLSPGTSDGVFYGTQLYIALKKFDDYGTGQMIIRDISPRDVFVFRLAEMYLIKAEAALATGGNAAGELTPLLSARSAAGLYSYGNIEDILKERGRELCGEQIRWFDLKRTGKLTAEYLTGKNAEAAEGIKPYHRLRPIPQVQIDAVTNPDVFTQNPGYSSE